MLRQQLILTLLWWGWGLALLVLLVVLSYQPAIFGDDVSAAWEWFLPNIIPTLGLVGAASYQRRRSGQDAPASSHLFLITVAASAVYLLLLTAAELSVLFTTDPVKTLRTSSLWLAPLQGLCASALGVFFAGESPQG